MYFHSSPSELHFEVGDYQENTRFESVATSKTKVKRVSVVVLSFGLLCVLQAILNISLRLTLTHTAETVSSRSDSTRVPEVLNRTEEVRDRRCPPGWWMFGTSCYFISSQRKDWAGGRRDCEQRGAHLVIINSRQEQAFLTGFSEAAWVGMTDREKEGTWVWLDGTLVNKNKLQWAPGQPDNAFGGEDCGDLRAMNNFTGLNDLKCANMLQWICEKTLSSK